MSSDEPSQPQPPAPTPNAESASSVSIAEARAAMVKVAARQIGARRDQVGFEASSIVQEVLANHWDRIRNASDDRNSLMRNLFGQMKRQIVDRIRIEERGGPRGSLNATDFAQPSAGGPSPSEIVAGQESEGVLDAPWEKASRLQAIIEAALSDPRDRRLAWMYLCEAMSSEEVGEALNMTAVHVRVRANEIKHRTAAVVLARLEGALDPDTAMRARSLFTNSSTAAEIAASIGLDEVALRRRLFRALRQPALRRYGEPGARLFHACLARTRRKTT